MTVTKSPLRLSAGVSREAFRLMFVVALEHPNNNTNHWSATIDRYPWPNKAVFVWQSLRISVDGSLTAEEVCTVKLDDKHRSSTFYDLARSLRPQWKSLLNQAILIAQLLVGRCRWTDGLHRIIDHESWAHLLVFILELFGGHMRILTLEVSTHLLRYCSRTLVAHWSPIANYHQGTTLS